MFGTIRECNGNLFPYTISGPTDGSTDIVHHDDDCWYQLATAQDGQFGAGYLGITCNTWPPLYNPACRTLCVWKLDGAATNVYIDCNAGCNKQQRLAVANVCPGANTRNELQATNVEYNQCCCVDTDPETGCPVYKSILHIPTACIDELRGVTLGAVVCETDCSCEYNMLFTDCTGDDSTIYTSCSQTFGDIKFNPDRGMLSLTCTGRTKQEGCAYTWYNVGTGGSHLNMVVSNACTNNETTCIGIDEYKVVIEHGDTKLCVDCSTIKTESANECHLNDTAIFEPKCDACCLDLRLNNLPSPNGTHCYGSIGIDITSGCPSTVTSTPMYYNSCNCTYCLGEHVCIINPMFTTEMSDCFISEACLNACGLTSVATHCDYANPLSMIFQCGTMIAFATQYCNSTCDDSSSISTTPGNVHIATQRLMSGACYINNGAATYNTNTSCITAVTWDPNDPSAGCDCLYNIREATQCHTLDYICGTGPSFGGGMYCHRHLMELGCVSSRLCFCTASPVTCDMRNEFYQEPSCAGVIFYDCQGAGTEICQEIRLSKAGIGYSACCHDFSGNVLIRGCMHDLAGCEYAKKCDIVSNIPAAAMMYILTSLPATTTGYEYIETGNKALNITDGIIYEATVSGSSITWADTHANLLATRMPANRCYSGEGAIWYDV